MSKNLISLAAAKELTKRYRANLDNVTTAEYAGSLKYSETFDADAIRAILNQPGCVEFRAYYGMKEDKSVCSIFVGVDDTGQDIVSTNIPGAQDIIADWGTVCPPDCPPSLL